MKKFSGEPWSDLPLPFRFRSKAKNSMEAWTSAVESFTCLAS